MLKFVVNFVVVVIGIVQCNKDGLVYNINKIDNQVGIRKRGTPRNITFTPVKPKLFETT